MIDVVSGTNAALFLLGKNTVRKERESFNSCFVSGREGWGDVILISNT